MNRKKYTMYGVAATLVAFAAPVWATEILVDQEVFISFTGGYEDYTIPVNSPPTHLRLTVYGADGGDAKAGPELGCIEQGGQGGKTEAVFRIGHEAGHLAPGGTIRFIVGEAGETGEDSASWPHSAGGGGGGGSGVIYRAPGVNSNDCGTDWVVLVAAGGGGGSYIGTGIGCVNAKVGGHARTSECGGSGGGGDGGAGGCNGEEGENGGGGQGGGGGAGALGESNSNTAAGKGCPSGGEGGEANDSFWAKGGWGFGGGGYEQDDAGGGGGGFSGGGGGGSEDEGGGGGSFVSNWAINSHRSSSNGNKTNGEGRYLAIIVDEACADKSDCNANGMADDCDLDNIGQLEDFETGNSNYQLNGDAVINNGSVRLTSSSSGQNGSVIFAPISSELVGEFTIEFDFKMGGGNGADGMSFALIDAKQTGNDILLGEGGAGQPLVISLDTYAGDADGGNHAEILSHGTSIARVQVPHTLNNNTWQHASALFANGALTLVLDDGFLNKTTVFQAVAVSGYSPVRARYGFGGRTGAATDVHRVDNVRFSIPADNDCDANLVPDDCQPDSDSNGTPDECEDDDGDGVPNFADRCPGYDDSIDSDGDTVADGCDICQGSDDTADADGDTIPDGCDNCADVNVRNATQNTYHQSIAEAINASSPGDVIQLGACVFNERNLVLNGGHITLRGEGATQTIIDGEDVNGRILDIRNSNGTTIRDITFRKGFLTGSSGGSALAIRSNSTVTVRSCRFVNNESFNAIGGAVYLAGGSTAEFKECEFSKNGSVGVPPAVAMTGSETSAAFVNSLFHSNSSTSYGAVECKDGTMEFVNCTFAKSHTNVPLDQDASATVLIRNCVFDESSGLFSVSDALRCLYPNATGDNIDGVPTFVDASSDDFRLAGGSLGIDAGDSLSYLLIGGGGNDLGGDTRLRDDSGTANTGSGSALVLDLGAFEFQGFSDNDGDGVGNANDGCPNDPDKITPGVCGCGVADDDSDADGTADCNDLCPGFDDNADADADTIPDGCDNCADVNIRNETQVTYHQTIAEAIAASSSGDVIRLGACVFEERELEIDGWDITLRGASDGQTIFDGTGVAGRILDLKNSDGSKIIDITFRNGLAVGITGGAALAVRSNSSVEVQRCRFENNDAGSANIGAVHLGGNSVTVFERCIFEGNVSSGNASAVGINGDDTEAFFANSLFSGNVGDANSVIRTRCNAYFVNCTFAENQNAQLVERYSGGIVTYDNCVHDVTSLPDDESFADHCLFPGATSMDNIDGEPTFVDTANGDFRLAAGSLGIDAGYRNQLVGATDLNGDPRAHDDLGTANTGGGSPSYMDLGAYEFQGFSDDDGDGVGNADDVCPGFDDNVDADIDGAPDGCDLCPGFDDSVDGDGNGVPDGCDVQPATVIAAGPRYLQVTPGESGTPVALYVTSPDAPCMAMYVDFDADTNLASQGICTLIDTPVYRLPEDWGTLLVRNMDIVPGYEYSVQPQTESAGLVASASSATTFVYGDVNNNGIANIEDAFFVVQGFQGTWAGSLGAVDMGPCYPNGIVNLGDVQQTILAFQGQAYDELCSMPCGVTAATASHAYAPTATVELEIRQGDARLGGAVEVDVWATDAIDLHTFQLAIELADASGNVRVADAMYIDADESAFAFASKEFLAADNVSRGEIGLVSLEGAIDVSSDQPAYLATFAFNGPFEPGEVLTVRFDSAGNMARDTSGRAIELLGLRTAADFEIGASSTRRAKQSGYELDRFNR